MDLTTHEITPDIAARVLYHFGYPDDGIPAGDWLASLLAVIDGADYDNARRLALAFPGITAAVRLAKYNPDGISRLHRIARAGT